MVSVHTSPLEQPGTGDAGGMNVYVAEVAKQLAARGVEVDIFTRATTGALPPIVELVPGVSVRHITAGPYEGLSKDDLPGQLCAFTAGVMRAAAARPEGWYDLAPLALLAVRPGRLARRRPVGGPARAHHAHHGPGQEPLPADRRQPRAARAARSARPRSSRPPTGWSPTPTARPRSSSSSTTPIPARSASSLPASTSDLHARRPGRGPERASACPADALVLLFVGRIQPLKRPDVLLRVGAELLRRHPDWRDAAASSPSSAAPAAPGSRAPASSRRWPPSSASRRQTRFVPPVSRPELAQWYRAADLVAVPSHSESFGLVALEAQACGTPVVAADVGGLPIVVGDTGLLVDGPRRRRRGPTRVESPARRPRRGAETSDGEPPSHAQGSAGRRPTDHLLEVYARGPPGPDAHPDGPLRRRGPGAGRP